MDYDRTFKPQMNRLAAAYRVEIPATTMAAYWTVFSGSDDARFAAACERALETERAFPPPAALKEIMRSSYEVARRTPGSSDAPGTVHRWQPYELDAVVLVPKPTPWRVGTKAHERWLDTSLKLIGTLETLVARRSEEMERNPDPDLARRVDILSKALVLQYRWHEHFEKTGESLVWEGGAS